MVKFILLGQARSGTWLCVDYLNSHPEVCCAGELFHFSSEIRRSMYRDALGKFDPRVEEEAIKSNLEGYFYRPASLALPAKSATGMKVLYEHGKLPWARADIAIERNLEIRIVHLTRRNPFHVMVSWWIACLEGTWMSSQTIRSLTIDPETAEAWLIERDWWFAWLDRQRKSHKVFDIEYSQLFSSPKRTMTSVFEFLGVSSCKKIQSHKVKQDNRPLSEKIVNIEALKRHFKDTKWETFLTKDFEV